MSWFSFISAPIQGPYIKHYCRYNSEISYESLSVLGFNVWVFQHLLNDFKDGSLIMNSWLNFKKMSSKVYFCLQLCCNNLGKIFVLEPDSVFSIFKNLIIVWGKNEKDFFILIFNFQWYLIQWELLRFTITSSSPNSGSCIFPLIRKTTTNYNLHKQIWDVVNADWWKYNYCQC